MNFACKRMELETIILRQVTQTQNHIHAMCSQIILYWSKKYKITRIQNSRSQTINVPNQTWEVEESNHRSGEGLKF